MREPSHKDPPPGLNHSPFFFFFFYIETFNCIIYLIYSNELNLLQCNKLPLGDAIVKN